MVDPTVDDSIALFGILVYVFSAEDPQLEWLMNHIEEQDKSSDIEQQPPFGDRKYGRRS